MPEELPKHKNVLSEEDSIISKIQALELSLEEMKSSQEEWATTLLVKLDSIANLEALKFIDPETPDIETKMTPELISALIFLICTLAVAATIYALFLVQQMESSWQKRVQEQIDEAITLDQIIRVLKEEKRNARSNN